MTAPPSVYEVWEDSGGVDAEFPFLRDCDALEPQFVQGREGQVCIALRGVGGVLELARRYQLSDAGLQALSLCDVSGRFSKNDVVVICICKG